MSKPTAEDMLGSSATSPRSSGLTRRWTTLGSWRLVIQARQLSGAQVLVLIVGLVVAGLACVYVPHQAQAVRSGSSLRAAAGYYFLWSPPDPAETCQVHFEGYFRRGVCYVQPLMLPAAFSALSALALTAAVVVGLSYRFREPGGSK